MATGCALAPRHRRGLPAYRQHRRPRQGPQDATASGPRVELVEQDPYAQSTRVATGREITVSPLLVERWARACEVQVLLGIDHEHLNRLDNAMVASVGALSRQGVTRLRELVATANGGTDGLPPPTELRRWIQLAQTDPRDGVARRSRRRPSTP